MAVGQSGGSLIGQTNLEDAKENSQPFPHRRICAGIAVSDAASPAHQSTWMEPNLARGRGLTIQRIEFPRRHFRPISAVSGGQLRLPARAGIQRTSKTGSPSSRDDKVGAGLPNNGHSFWKIIGNCSSAEGAGIEELAPAGKPFGCISAEEHYSCANGQ